MIGECSFYETLSIDRILIVLNTIFKLFNKRIILPDLDFKISIDFD